METITLSYCYSHKASGNEDRFKTKCPSCSGSNLYVTKDNGFAFCFNCFAQFAIEGLRQVYSRTVKQLQHTAQEIRELYERSCRTFQAAMQRSHVDYLLRRGINKQTQEQFRIGYSATLDTANLSLYNDAGLAWSSGGMTLRDRITIPYIANGEVTDFRGRTLVNDDPKYKSLFNPSYLRGAIYPFNWDYARERAEHSKLLLITEGEIKAIAAYQYGYAAVALPGMLSWRAGLVPERDWKVVLMFDNSSDPKARRDVDRAMYRVGSRLPNSASVHIATLPLMGEDKMDIDSYLLHKDQKFDRLIQGAIQLDHYKELRKF